ncbi:MAG: zinc-binding dehydrogenase [Myxococcaceae bacterium]
MQAIVLTKFGGPEVLEQRDVGQPSPGPGQLLVRVHASGTNPVDAKIRAAGGWAQITPPCVIGYDASGVIEALGVGVSGFSRGDEVFFTPEIFGNVHGTYAECALVEAAIVAPKPKGLSHVEAAAVPLAGGTAFEAVVRRLSVRPGETLLIHGAAGGVGTFAVQLGKLCGARVIGTASEPHHKLLRDLGADVCIDYRKENVFERTLKETGGVGVDAVFDCVGGDHIQNSAQCTKPFGRLASILGPKGDFTMLYLKNQTYHGVFMHREGARLKLLGNLLERKALRPIIAETLPLSDVRKAHERLDSGHGAGKIVLEVARG